MSGGEECCWCRNPEVPWRFALFLSPLGCCGAERWGQTLSVARAMDGEPGRRVSAALGEIHFPAARGDGCGPGIIYLLRSQVGNRQGPRRATWSGAQLGRLPARCKQASTGLYFVGCSQLRQSLRRPLGMDP